MPDFMECKVVPLLACCLCILTFIFACVAVPLSFKSLEQGRYALELDWLTQMVSDDVVTEPGMKMVGLGNMLLEYPSTFQTMYFVSEHSSRGIAGGEESSIRGPIRARTQDGLEMHLSVSFQWKLESYALKPLYTILGQEYYRDEFVRFARSALVKAAANFGAYTYFTNRTTITNTMLEDLQSAFNRSDIMLQATIKGLQLREVDLPDDFDQEIALTQEQVQEVAVAEAEREEQRIAMLREQVVAENKKKEIREAALGRARAIELENEAVVHQILVYQEQQAIANAEILRGFADDPDPFARLFEMMEIRAIGDHHDDRLMVNL